MDPTETGTAELRGRKREIVALLATRRRLSVAQLAAAFGLTAGGVRQQLAQLESAGAVVHEPGPGGRGRFFYSLAPMATKADTGVYHRFVARLLRAIETEQPGTVERAAARACEAWPNGAGEVGAEARIEAARRALEEQGFAAQAEPLSDSVFSLRLLSCPIQGLAAEFRGLCMAEEQYLLRSLSGLRIEREAWRLAGAPECSYLVGGGGSAG